jgi:DNA mismatch repair protein MutS2
MTLSEIPGGALCPQRTREDLEWDALLGALASRCQSPSAKRLALALPFGATYEESRTWLRESAEAKALADRHEPLPAPSLPDVDDALARLGAQGVLSAFEIRDLGLGIAAARSLRRFLNGRRETAPTLYAAYATDPSLDDLEREIAAAVDADGTIADRASAELKRLRDEQRAARARMLSKLEDLMSRHEKLLQDRFVTEREGRFVLPVRSDAHERFPGIVHGTSGSGATIFVEPRAVIPLGNRLKMLEADVAREELAVLTRLSALLYGSLLSLRGAIAALAWADIRAAVARLAEDLALTTPEVVDEARIDLRNARHPLLALAPPKGGVVASDLRARGGHAIVVSGPNAGGKTVALKTLGLAALMIRAGLPVPCGDGSVVGLFDAVLSDVGDSQSIKTNLSTFSAHVSNIVRILDATHDRALVLLDELAGGTDPREGEALAAGVLDSLCARGGAVVATTHYEGLKMLGLGDDRFENASVGFDLPTMAPTFRVTMGVPGSSSALAIARRFGMPGTVIERAERFLSPSDKNFDELVRRLEVERAGLELARADAQRKAEAAEVAKRELEEEIEAVRRRETQTLARETENLVASVRRAKEDLRAAQTKLRAKKIEARDVREAERAIDRVAAQVAVGGELEPRRDDEAPRAPVARGELRKGMNVYVPRLRFEAEVVEVFDNGSVRVAAGPLKILVTAEELRAGAAGKGRGEPKSERSPKSERRSKDEGPTSEARLEVAIQTSDNTVDVRGLRVDDGVAMAMQFLDRTLNQDREVAFIVHGHGSGALRDAIRKELKTGPNVTFFRPGNRDEGGDGVTVVWVG